MSVLLRCLPARRTLALPAVLSCGGWRQRFASSLTPAPGAESAAHLKHLCAEARQSLSSLRDVLRFCATRLTKSAAFFGHGTQDPYEEAIFLLSHATRLQPNIMEPLMDARLTATERDEILDLLMTRINQRIPVAYLANAAVLGDQMFFVDKRVIVPRSYIAETLRGDVSPFVAAPDQVTHVLDMCTGSGCLAILSAQTFPNAAVDAVDVSEPALQVAARNVSDYGLEDRVALRHSDMFAALKSPKEAKQYDVIISNPPYVKSSDMTRLPDEFKHEPALALDGGADGLTFVHTIMKEAYAHLKTNGILIVEVGDLRPAVEAAYPRMPFTWLTTSQGDDMVFLLRKNDFERLIPASAKSSASSAAGPRSGRNAAAAADAHGAMEDAAPFAATLSKIASGKRKL